MREPKVSCCLTFTRLLAGQCTCELLTCKSLGVAYKVFHLLALARCPTTQQHRQSHRLRSRCRLRRHPLPRSSSESSVLPSSMSACPDRSLTVDPLTRYRLYETSYDPDFTIEVGGLADRTFWVHRDVLCLHSKFFRDVCSDDTIAQSVSRTN